LVAFALLIAATSGVPGVARRIVLSSSAITMSWSPASYWASGLGLSTTVPALTRPITAESANASWVSK